MEDDYKDIANDGSTIYRLDGRFYNGYTDAVFYLVSQGFCARDACEYIQSLDYEKSKL